MTRARCYFLLRALFSSGLIAFLLSRIRWGEIVGLLRGVHPMFALAAPLFSLAALLLMAARTRLLLRHWGIVLDYRAVLAVTWLGQFCNSFLPGSTGGDVAKFYRVCRLAPGSKTAGFAALVADRLVALVALVLLAGAALVFGDHSLFGQLADGVTLEGSGRPWIAGFGLALFAAVLMIVASGRLRRSGRFAGASAKWRRVREEMRMGLRDGPFLSTALMLAVAVHLSSLSGFYLFAKALQVPATFGQLMVVWPVVMVVTLLPLTVNGYGLRECVMIYYFQHWHLVSGLRPETNVRETVIALSLLAVFNDFFWSLPGAFCLAAGTSVRSETAPASREPAVPEPVFGGP